MGDSNNSLTAFDPQYWSAVMQELRFKKNVAIPVCNTELRADLPNGTRVHKPYRSYPWVTDYTKGQDITVKDRSGVDEYMDVDQVKIAPFYVDDLDQLHNKWDTAETFAQDAMKGLSNTLDQKVMATGIAGADKTLYLADLGGTGSTTPVPLTTANIEDLFTASARRLDESDADADKFALIGPRMVELIRKKLAGREDSFGASVGANGVIGNRFGFQIKQSNNLKFTATLTTSDAIVAGETVTIAGCTFTFVTSGTAAAAGEVSVGANQAAATANLVLAINGTGTPGAATYIEPSAKNRKKLLKAGAVATDSTTSIGLVAYGDIVVAETISEAANVWSAQKSYPLFGMIGAIDLLVVKNPNVVFNRAPLRLGRYVLPWMNYGTKVFDENTDKLVAACVDASAWV